MTAVDKQSVWSRRLAWGALAVAIVLFVAVVLFGFFAPPQWGHYGYHLGEYTLRARNTLRFHTLIPSHWTGPGTPPPDSYYLHHPILAHQFLTLAFWLFGEHFWLVRAIPALWALTTLLAVFSIVRRHWGHGPAAAAVLCYATLPFTQAFSIHYDPGHLALPAMLIAMDAWLRYRESPRLGTALVAIGGFAIGGLTEWTPYLCTAYFVPIAFLLGFSSLERGRRTWLGTRPSQRLVFLMGLTMLCTIGFHFWFTRHAGVLADLKGSCAERSASPGWATTGKMQWLWFTMYFGKPYLVVAAAWALTAFGRLVALRGRGRDLVPLTLLAAWATYVALFPRGLNIHSYRIMPLSLLMPLALASVLTDAAAAVKWLAPRLRAPRRLAVALPAVVAIAAFAALMRYSIPEAHAALLSARATAGTAEYAGYSPHLEEFLFARTIRERIPRDAVVLAHANLGVRIEFMAQLDREIRPVYSMPATLPKEKGRPVFIIWDHQGLRSTERTNETLLVAEHGVWMLNQFALSDGSSSHRAAETYQIETMQPSWRWKYFSSWAYPPMRVVPGVSAPIAYWLAVRGVELSSRAEVNRPALSDLPGLVNYLDLMVAYGDRPAQVAAVQRLIGSNLAQGPTVRPVAVAWWGVPRGSNVLRLVLTMSDEAHPDRFDLRVAYLTDRGERVVVTPTSEIPDQVPRIWRKGLYSLWNAPLPEMEARPATARLELYAEGHAPPASPPRHDRNVGAKAAKPSPPKLPSGKEPRSADKHKPGAPAPAADRTTPLAASALGRIEKR